MANLIRGYVHEVFGSFQGEGPYVGERHAFLRLCCCNLACAYCDSVESRLKLPHARLEKDDVPAAMVMPNPLTVESVVNAVRGLERFPGFNSALCVTGGEPLEQPEFVRAVLTALGGGMRVLLETNGTLPEAMTGIRSLVDVVSMDIKLPSVSKLPELWEEHRAFLKACAGKEIIVKAVVSRETPGEEAAQAARLVAQTAPEALLVLQPLTTPDGTVEIPAEKLTALFAAARRIAGRVRVIPQAHRMMGAK